MSEMPVEHDVGFTLLEVIVAFAVLALSLMAVNKSVALATTQIRRAEQLQRVEELAQNVMADILLSQHTIPRHATGASESDLRWELSAHNADPTGKLAVTRVTLTILADSGGRLRSYTTFLPTRAAQE